MLFVTIRVIRVFTAAFPRRAFEMVVLFNHARHPQGLHSAVEIGTTFFSLLSFVFTFLAPSLAKPGTGTGGASRGRLNVYDAIKSSVVQADTFRARKGYTEGLFGPPVLGILNLGDCVRPTLSSSYWPIQ